MHHALHEDLRWSRQLEWKLNKSCLLGLLYLFVFTGVIAALLFSGSARAAANCTITTTPSPAVITAGGSVDFSGSVSGKPPATYSWSFTGGSPASSSQQSVNVTYASAGSFPATLDGSNDKGQTCSASVTVTVNPATGNQPPTANDDAYNATEDTPLNISAPGVLGNDTDPDGDPLSVGDPRTNAPTAQGGTVTLNADGSFSYTPATGFTGDDTFTYVANDGTVDSNTATVTISVAPATGNQPPTANDDSYNTSQDTALNVGAPGVLANDTDADGDPLSVGDPRTNAPTAQGGTVTLNTDGSFSYNPANGFTGDDTFTYVANDGTVNSNTATVTITVNAVGGGPTSRGDTYATPVGTTLDVVASRVSGVLYNDFGGTPPLTAELVSGPAGGSLALNVDGSFSYTPNQNLADNDVDSFVYRAVDALGNPSADTTVNIGILSKQVDFKIFMNYELGMHCTGFEFAYCCVLPPYNSILAQVVRPQTPGEPVTAADFPRLLEGDPHNGLDGLGRETVMRDYESDGTFKKYYLEYFHDAQPRNEGQGKIQTSSLISAVEGNSLFYTSTIYDSAAIIDQTTAADCAPNPAPCNRGPLVTGTYEGADGVVLGDGDFNDNTDNYANGWLNHFYIYADLEGSNPNNSSLEKDKIRLGVTGNVEYPADVGAALQPMGPTGSAAPFDNVLTFSADTGTVVYTQMKVLENLPVMLTSPRIWEALGLPLTPFEDSIDFFGDPGLVDEDSIRPYVAMKARLHEANCDGAGNCTQGPAVIGSNGHPVIGFGTAPIDIPNCERCHSVPSTDGQGNPNVNSPAFIRTDFAFPHAGTFSGASLDAVTDAEYQFWNAYYNIVPGTDSDWYSRLKGAAINMLALHDFDQGTGFTSNWPSGSINDPVAQNTRLGKESVICQKCHGDNVIAVVKSASKNGNVIKPITEAIHWRHREISEGGSIDFSDATGRSGGCQGCHPAHRSDGVMDGYPITLGGDNFQANSDNRLAAGGCFVGRDVHSNPNKDNDGAETPAHLNAVGQYLATNVFYNQDGEGGIAGDDTRGLWCTNCHSQLGQEIWAAEDCNDLINGDCVNDVRGLGSLSQIASAIGSNLATVESWLDPRDNIHATTPDGIDHSHRIWDPAVSDALLATIEVGPGGPVVTTDADGDISVNILSFCTTPDCVSRINANKNDQSQWRYPANPFIDTANDGVAVPFSAATDGRDHWLSPGEPHCADCHSAPYVEQSGNINAFPPFNYPAKASLMRYSRGHQDVTCQGCHESIHGLYPVTPTIDSTSYAQAAALNADGSHGPLKCGTCHTVDGEGIPTWIRKGRIFGNNLDEVTTWAHTYTDEADPLVDTCLNCHGDRTSKIKEDSGKWLRHAFVGRIGRLTQDKAEINSLGYVAGDPDPDGIPNSGDERDAQAIADTVCSSCHSLQGGPSGAFLNLATCNNTTWLQHLSQGRIAEKVWEFISVDQNGNTCGW